MPTYGAPQTPINQQLSTNQSLVASLLHLQTTNKKTQATHRNSIRVEPTGENRRGEKTERRTGGKLEGGPFGQKAAIRSEDRGKTGGGLDRRGAYKTANRKGRIQPEGGKAERRTGGNTGGGPNRRGESMRGPKEGDGCSGGRNNDNRTIGGGRTQGGCYGSDVHLLLGIQKVTGRCDTGAIEQDLASRNKRRTW